MTLKDEFVIMKSDSEEEYMDDLIIIIDEGDKLSPSKILEYDITSETKCEEKDNISKVSLINNSLGTTNNIHLLTKCKSFDIKIVDYVKYPHYYKTVKSMEGNKHITKEATNKVKVPKNTVLSSIKSETKNKKCRSTKKQNINTIVSATRDTEIEHVQNFNMNDGIKNTSSINFKRNVGLVGIKISNVGLLGSNPVKWTGRKLKSKDRSKRTENQSNEEEKLAKLNKYDNFFCKKSKKVTTVHKQDNKETLEGKIFLPQISKNKTNLPIPNMSKTNSKNVDGDDDHMKLDVQNNSENNLRPDTEKGKDILDNKLRKNSIKFTKPLQDIKLISNDSFPKAVEQPEIGIVRPMKNTITPTLLTNAAISKLPDIYNNLSMNSVNATNNSPQANSVYDNCVKQLPRGDSPSYNAHYLDGKTSVSNHLNNQQQEPKKHIDQNRNTFNYQDASSIQTKQTWFRRVPYQGSYSTLPALPSLDNKICRAPLTKQFVNTNEPLCQIPHTQTSEKQGQESNGSEHTPKIQAHGQLRHYTSANQQGHLNGHKFSTTEPYRYSVEQPSSNAFNNHKQVNLYQHKLASLEQLTYNYPGMRPTLHYGQSQPHQINYGQPLHNHHLQGQTSPNLLTNAQSEHNQLLARRSTLNFKSNGQPGLNQHLANQSLTTLSVNGQPAPYQHFENQSSTNLSVNGQPPPYQHFANQSSANLSVNGQPARNQHLANQSLTTLSVNGQPAPYQHFENQSSTNLSVNGQPPPYQHFANQSSANLSVNGQPARNQHLANQSLTTLSVNGQPAPYQHFENQSSTNLSVNGQPPPYQHFANQSSAKLSVIRQPPPYQHFANQLSANLSDNGQPPPYRHFANQSSANSSDNGQPATNQHFANQSSTILSVNGQPAPNFSVNVQPSDQPSPSQPIYNNSPPYQQQKSQTCSQAFNQTQPNRHIPIQPLPMQCVTGQPRKRQYDQSKPTNQPMSHQAKNQSIIGCNAEGLVKRINIQKKTRENLVETNKTGGETPDGQPYYKLHIDKTNLKIDVQLSSSYVAEPKI